MVPVPVVPVAVVVAGAARPVVFPVPVVPVPVEPVPLVLVVEPVPLAPVLVPLPVVTVPVVPVVVVPVPLVPVLVIPVPVVAVPVPSALVEPVPVVPAPLVPRDGSRAGRNSCRCACSRWDGIDVAAATLPGGVLPLPAVAIGSVGVKEAGGLPGSDLIRAAAGACRFVLRIRAGRLDRPQIATECIQVRLDKTRNSAIACQTTLLLIRGDFILLLGHQKLRIRLVEHDTGELGQPRIRSRILPGHSAD